jgi:NADH-quinone oxidoreductase subunit E
MTSTIVSNVSTADIVSRYPANRGSLIQILQDIQDRDGYLSEEAVGEVEAAIGISANEIFGVATFYTQFRFHPPGDHLIHVCQGTACHVRGGAQNMQELQQRLKIKAGEITPDNKFELGRVACLGCCALAPVVSIDGHVYARVTPKKLPAILDEY